MTPSIVRARFEEFLAEIVSNLPSVVQIEPILFTQYTCDLAKAANVSAETTAFSCNDMHREALLTDEVTYDIRTDDSIVSPYTATSVHTYAWHVWFPDTDLVPDSATPALVVVSYAYTDGEWVMGAVLDEDFEAAEWAYEAFGFVSGLGD